jgi:hypothetical protein
MYCRSKAFVDLIDKADDAEDHRYAQPQYDKGLQKFLDIEFLYDQHIRTPKFQASNYKFHIKPKLQNCVVSILFFGIYL